MVLVPIMTASPAVILNNIPKHLMKNGQMISQAVLGSKTGKEVGACFWKIHSNQPKFMIIFKHKTDRDSWHKNSSLLKDVMEKHGVRTTLVWYCRDRDPVIAEVEGSKYDKERRKEGNNNQLLSESPSPSINSCTSVIKGRNLADAFGTKFEILDNLDVSQDPLTKTFSNQDASLKSINLPEKQTTEPSILQGLSLPNFHPVSESMVNRWSVDGRSMVSQWSVN